MKTNQIVLAALTLVFMTGVSVLAQEGARDTTLQLPNTTLRAVSDAEVNAIARELIAPCCWSQTADVHRSEAAEEVKNNIRLGLQNGYTKDQIVAAFVEYYGERILAKPTATGFNMLVYILPAVAFVIGGFIVWRYLRRVRPLQVNTTAKPAKPSATNERYEQRFERELSEFDT